jgi:hypothetical protein
MSSSTLPQASPPHANSVARETTTPTPANVTENTTTSTPRQNPKETPRKVREPLMTPSNTASTAFSFPGSSFTPNTPITLPSNKPALQTPTPAPKAEVTPEQDPEEVERRIAELERSLGRVNVVKSPAFPQIKYIGSEIAYSNRGMETKENQWVRDKIWRDGMEDVVLKGHGRDRK